MQCIALDLGWTSSKADGSHCVEMSNFHPHTVLFTVGSARQEEAGLISLNFLSNRSFSLPASSNSFLSNSISTRQLTPTRVVIGVALYRVCSRNCQWSWGIAQPSLLYIPILWASKNSTTSIRINGTGLLKLVGVNGNGTPTPLNSASLKFCCIVFGFFLNEIFILVFCISAIKYILD